jgi:deoxyribonuclease V
MKLPAHYSFPSDPGEAIALQRQLAERVVQNDKFTRLQRVAGIDVGFEGPRKEIARAAVIILSFPDLKVVESSIQRMPVSYPYIPGLLAFREAPVVLGAIEKLHNMPDLLIVDGQGRAHPRRLGIASHLGVILNCPSIGCAKSRLVGKAQVPANIFGATSELVDADETVGLVVRTRENTKPLYVSIGHRVSLGTAADLVLACTRGYRLPEPTRLAHKLASGGAKRERTQNRIR